jgi:predicted Rossmann-fold nucleotide-binding protein
MGEFVSGFDSLAEIGPAVTIFGSARVGPDHPMYKAAREVGGLLAKSGLATITGGGPGIMEAANRGASEAGGVSVGANIELPMEQGVNRWVNVPLNFRYFFVRKTMFVKYAFDSEFWAGLVDWIEKRLVTDLMIKLEDRNLFRITDDPQEAVDVMLASFRKHSEQLLLDDLDRMPGDLR